MIPEDYCDDCAPVYWRDLESVNTIEPKIAILQRKIENNIQIFNNANSLLQSSIGGGVIQDNTLDELRTKLTENPMNFELEKIINQIEHNNQSEIEKQSSESNKLSK